MSWRRVSLGDAFEFVRNGKNVKQNKEFGGLPITRIETIADRTIDPLRVGYGGVNERGNEKWLLNHGDILFSHINSVDHIGKVAIYEGVPEKLVHGMNLLALRPGKLLYPKFGLYALSHDFFRAQLLPFVNKAVNQASVSTTNLKSLEIPLPPLDEQKRIATILDKADALRRQRRQALALLDSLTQSIFLEMFGERDRGEWLTYVPLINLIDAEDRLNYGVVQPGDQTDDGVPLIRVSDLKDGAVDRSNLRFIDHSINRKHARSVLKGSEILISCVGSIGEIALASSADKGSNIARAIARVPLRKDVSREFVAAYLRTDDVKRYFTKELRTVSQPTLNIKQISETLIPVPRDQDVRRFEEAVGRVAASNQISKFNLDRANSLFASLQHRAFSGQL